MKRGTSTGMTVQGYKHCVVSGLSLIIIRASICIDFTSEFSILSEIDKLHSMNPCWSDDASHTRTILDAKVNRKNVNRNSKMLYRSKNKIVYNVPMQHWSRSSPSRRL